MTFHLTDSQLDKLSQEFRAKAIASLPDRSASDAWHAAANLLHQSRMAAATGRSAAARAKRLTLQSREFASTL